MSYHICWYRVLLTILIIRRSERPASNSSSSLESLEALALVGQQKLPQLVLYSNWNAELRTVSLIHTSEDLPIIR